MIKRIVLILLLFSAHSYGQTYQVAEVTKEKDSFIINEHHQLGVFMFSIEPLKYHKKNKKIKLKGLAIYPGKYLYSSKYDTLYYGVGKVELYLGNYNSSEKKFNQLKKIEIADCNGLFKINIKRKKDVYLIFKYENLTMTAFNTKSYFELYEKKTREKIVFKKNSHSCN